MWDAPLQIIEEERAHRPDIFFINNHMRKAYTLEFVVSSGRHVLESAIEKRDIYALLAK